MSTLTPSDEQAIPAPRTPQVRKKGANLEKAGWIYMRVSGVLLVVLIFGHLFVNLMLGEGIHGIDFAFVAGKFASPFWQVWDVLMLWLALIHGANGMRTIVNDYVVGATTRKVLARMLSIQQYVVVEAGSGAEALSLLDANPDLELVVSDYYMPDMDGFELARRIRRRHPKVRLIGISSSTDRQTSAGFLKAGAHDFVSRPFVLEELQCRIASNVETLIRLKRLQELAARDYLTNLFNRRHFFEHGPALVETARQGGFPVSIALLDIDHFKQMNDRHGHDGGDQVLDAVARNLSRLAERETNLLARVGGEEFAILFAGAGLDEACRLAEEIRREIARQPLMLAGEEMTLTVSIGVTEISGAEKLGASLNRADRALYAAKQEGRNRVCSAVAEA